GSVGARGARLPRVPAALVPWESLRLSTDRLCLRPPTARDAEALYGLFADAEDMFGRAMTPVSAWSVAGALIGAGIDSWRTDGLGPFVFEDPATGRIVG